MNRSGTISGYTVEMRYNSNKPIKVGDLVIDNRWQEYYPTKSLIGVPVHKTALHETGTFSFEAAQAIRWWLYAELEWELTISCFETRIVEHKITYTYTKQRVAEHCIVGDFNRKTYLKETSPDET
jgi:hypothetical protein